MSQLSGFKCFWKLVYRWFSRIQNITFFADQPCSVACLFRHFNKCDDYQKFYLTVRKFWNLINMTASKWKVISSAGTLTNYLYIITFIDMSYSTYFLHILLLRYGDEDANPDEVTNPSPSKEMSKISYCNWNIKDIFCWKCSFSAFWSEKWWSSH